jgi:hypothetical protein
MHAADLDFSGTRELVGPVSPPPKSRDRAAPLLRADDRTSR